MGAIKWPTLEEKTNEYNEYIRKIDPLLVEALINPKQMPPLDVTAMDTITYIWVEGGGLPNRLGGETALFIVPGKTALEITSCRRSQAGPRPKYTWTINVSGPHYGRRYSDRKVFGEQTAGMIRVRIGHQKTGWRAFYDESCGNYSTLPWAERLYRGTLQSFYKDAVAQGALEEQKYFPTADIVVRLAEDAGLVIPVGPPPSGDPWYGPAFDGAEET